MIRKNRFNRLIPQPSEEDRKRRKREFFLIGVIVAVVGILTYVENRVIYSGVDFPVSNAILMFILININLLLLLLLIFLVFRNLVKLLYDRKRRVMGAKLRTRLVLAFIGLALVPTTVLFFFSIHFITTSIEFWFNIPVEKALENSLEVGRHLYAQTESRSRFFMEKAVYQIRSKDYLSSEKREELARYLQIVQQEFDIHALEVYDAEGRRLYLALSNNLKKAPPDPLAMASFQKEFGPTHIRSISKNLPGGELNQFIGTIPFGAEGANIMGFIVLSTLIPSELGEKLNAISRGYEEYQQIQLLKRPIRVTYYITLSVVALLVLFCAIWFGFHIAKSISVPIKELAEGTRRVAEGDLGFSIAMVGDDEIGSLVESFNRMTRDLRTNREQLELSARMLRDQNMEIEERRQYMEIVLQNISTGVISLNARGFVTTINKSAEHMLNLRAEKCLNRNYRKLVTGEHLSITEDIMEKIESGRENAVQLPVRITINGRPRSFMFYVNALKNEKGHHIGSVAVFEDLTDQEKAQRMAAWREVARRIAHEVKNPLTPVTLSAQRLKRKYSAHINEHVFDECVQMIIDQVELIRNLVNEFAKFAKFPTADPERCDLPPIIEETLALYRESHPGIRFEQNIPENLICLNLDRLQMKQAMINLVNNAISAMKNRGQITITVIHDPVLKLVRIEVADTGPGISNEDKTRLFEPYFSTKKTGMGLGLTIVSTIIADHKGSIRVQDNYPKGTKFIIELPT